MQGKTNQLKIGPIQGENKEIITDELKKAEHINDYFSTVGEKLVKNIVHNDDFTQMQHFYRITPTIDSMSINLKRLYNPSRKELKQEKAMAQIV